MSPANQNQRFLAGTPNKNSVKHAVQAIGLIVAVVLFNLGLCVGIFWLVRRNLVGGIFPALVLFLSFALSVGVILITVLGEKVDKSNIENEWIKKIGVTPIMAIVAVLISILASFSPLANKIIEIDPYSGHFMLAKIKVTCSTQATSDLPQATDLLVFISGETDYIKKINDFLNSKSLKSWMETPQDPLVQIVGADPNNETYRLLLDYGGSESLTNEMSSEENWVAYKTQVKAPNIATVIPIPTIFERRHTTRLFVITKQLTRNNQPELTSLNAAASSATSTKLKLTRLFQAEIIPRKPVDETYLTDLSFRFFTESVCWHVPG